jgi:hypothetical protein
MYANQNLAPKSIDGKCNRNQAIVARGIPNNREGPSNGPKDIRCVGTPGLHGTSEQVKASLPSRHEGEPADPHKTRHCGFGRSSADQTWSTMKTFPTVGRMRPSEERSLFVFSDSRTTHRRSGYPPQPGNRLRFARVCVCMCAERGTRCMHQSGLGCPAAPPADATVGVEWAWPWAKPWVRPWPWARLWAWPWAWARPQAAGVAVGPPNLPIQLAGCYGDITPTRQSTYMEQPS